MAIKAEGMIDTSLYGETFSSWLKDTEMCLFRVENPLSLLRAQTTKLDLMNIGKAESQEASKRELKAQIETSSKGIGTIIKYGQQILLRHLSSEGLLTLNTMGTSPEPGTWEVLVSQDTSVNFVTKVALTPNNQLQKPGESVRYGDKLNIEFTADNQQYLLHTNKTANDGVFEVNASHVRSNWEFRKYENFNPNGEAIKGGVPIAISLSRRKMRVTEGVGKALVSKVSSMFGKDSDRPRLSKQPSVDNPSAFQLEPPKPKATGGWGLLKKAETTTADNEAKKEAPEGIIRKSGSGWGILKTPAEAPAEAEPIQAVPSLEKPISAAEVATDMKPETAKKQDETTTAELVVKKPASGWGVLKKPGDASPVPEAKKTVPGWSKLTSPANPSPASSQAGTPREENEPKKAENEPKKTGWGVLKKKDDAPAKPSEQSASLKPPPPFTQEANSKVERMPSPRKARFEVSKLTAAHSIFTGQAKSSEAPSSVIKKMQLTTEENNFGTLWIIEKVKPLEGGLLQWEERFYLKNVQSGRYVANADLEMKDEPEPDFSFMIVKPDSFRESSHIPLNYPIIIKSSSDLFLTPEKVMAEEEFMVDVVPGNASQDSGNVAYESNLLLTKDQDAESPLEVVEIDERDFIFFVRVTKLIPKVHEIRVILSNWIDQRGTLTHLDFYEKEDRVKRISENFCKSIDRMEGMLGESPSPEINAKRRCAIVGLGLASQMIELAGLLEEYSRLAKRLEEDERNSMGPVAAVMETKIWTFLKILVEDLEYTCANLARHDNIMLNLLPTRKGLIGPVITEIYRVLDPEIRDVRGFFNSWVQRLDSVTSNNVVDQAIFFQLIKNVCEVDDNPKPEYQRAVISLLYDEKKFYLIKLLKEAGRYYIHFFCLEQTQEDFLKANPDLAPYAEYSMDGVLVFSFENLSQLPEYVAYIQEALGLINVLCKGKVSAGREVVQQIQSIEVEDIISLFDYRGIHLSILQSLVDLIQALMVTTPPLVSFKEMEAENFCYEEEKCDDLETIRSEENSLLKPGTDPKIVKLTKATLMFWLSADRPLILRKLSEQELLEPVSSMLRLTASLMEYNHTNSLFTKMIAIVLAYILAGFSGERGRKFEERHWTVSFVQQLLIADDTVTGEVNSDIMDFFKLVIETLDLIQLKLKRNKLNSVVKFFESLQGCDISRDSEELLELIAALKCYSTSEITSVKEIKSFITPGDNLFIEFDFHMFTRPPRLPDYLLYAVLNLNSVHQGMKESVILTISRCFNEELSFLKDVKSIDLLHGEVSIKARLAVLKQELEPVDILSKSKLELNEGRQLVTLHFIKDVIFELISLVRPNGAAPIVYIQNMLRNLGFHRTLIQLWPLIGRLDAEKTLKEKDKELAFDFKSLLVSFFSYFVKQNVLNQKALKQVLQKKHFVMDFPEYADLIFELTHFTHMPQGRLQKFISGVVDRCATYSHPRELNSHHFLRLIMLSPSFKEEPAMQNIIARHIAEKFRDMAEFEFDDITFFKDAIYVELLSIAAISNSSITLMCRGIIPFARLVTLINKHTDAVVLSSLLHFLLYVYVWPGDEKTVKQVHPASIIRLFLKKLTAVLTPLFTDPGELRKIAQKNIYELVFTDQQWPMVAVNSARDPFDADLNKWRLMCAGTGDDMRQGGFLALIPRLIKYIDEREALANEVNAALQCVAQLKHIAEDSKGENISAGGLIKAIDSFEVEIDRAYPKAGAGEATEMSPTGFSVLLETKLGLVTGPQGMKKNGKFVEFLAAFTAAYRAERRIKAYDFAKPIARRFLRFTGFRKFKARIRKEDIATLCTNLLRLKRLFTQTDHRKVYFTILTHILPDEPEIKVKLNPSYMQSDVINEAVDELMQTNMGNVNSALLFLNKLLDEQTSVFQSYYQQLIDRSERSYHLFYKIKEELDTAKSIILTKASQEELAGFAMIKRKDRNPLSEREVFLVRSLKFLQLCCDNCNLDFQNYIRQQGNQIGKADIDLVSEVAQFLIDIQDKSRHLINQPGPGKIIIKALAALLDFVTGPCPENQERLGNNVLLFQAVNSFVKVTQMEQDDISIGIHNKIMVFLLTLLEDNPHPTVPLTMVKFIDLRLFREGVEKIYSDLIKNREEELYKETAGKDDNCLNKVKSAVLQAIFLIKLKKHCNHQELKKFMSDTSPAYEFYTSNIGYVQVEREGSIEEIYFPVPFMCKFLTPASRQNIILDVNRSSHQSKVEDFLSKIDYYHTEMQHQQHLSQHRWLKFTSKLWKLYAQMSYLMVLLINLLLLGTLSGSQEKSTTQFPWLWMALLSLGLMQLLLYVAYFVFNMIEYLPLRLRNNHTFESLEIDRYPNFPHNESYLLTDTYKSIESSSHDSTSFRNSLRDITQNLDFYYNFIYLLVAVLGLYEPLIYPVLMLDIVKQNQELVNILKSITVNLRQLLLTLVLGLIIVFLFSVHSFSHFQEYYNKENNADCSTLYNCFTSTLYFGIRAGGGIGDGLDPATSEDYWSRMAFDLLYYVIMIIILLNIIFGIIIDTFAQLRDERSEMMNDLTNTCFVCGMNRSQIELKGKGWSHHFMCEHSPLSYLAFFVYLKETNIVDCSGIEKYVKENMDEKDSSFMPTTSKLLQKKATS